MRRRYNDDGWRTSVRRRHVPRRRVVEVELPVEIDRRGLRLVLPAVLGIELIADQKFPLVPDPRAVEIEEPASGKRVAGFVRRSTLDGLPAQQRGKQGGLDLVELHR